MRFAVLSILADLPAGESMRRRAIANGVFGTDLVGAGDTYAACGWLAQRGWIEPRPWDRYRYRITDAGREQLEIQGAMRGEA